MKYKIQETLRNSYTDYIEERLTESLSNLREVRARDVNWELMRLVGTDHGFTVGIDFVERLCVISSKSYNNSLLLLGLRFPWAVESSHVYLDKEKECLYYWHDRLRRIGVRPVEVKNIIEIEPRHRVFFKPSMLSGYKIKVKELLVCQTM